MPVTGIKIVNTSSNPLPSYATSGASGMDLKADLKEPKTLLPFERVLIPVIGIDKPQYMVVK